MKYIIKQAEPQELLDFKAAANDKWTPTYSGLTSIAKKALRESLMKEQGYICCYCERTLTKNDLHIEHFKPQMILVWILLIFQICSVLVRKI